MFIKVDQTGIVYEINEIRSNDSDVEITGNYSLMDEKGRPNWKYVNNQMVSLTEAEKEATWTHVSSNGANSTNEQRISDLETAFADLAFGGGAT